MSDFAIRQTSTVGHADETRGSHAVAGRKPQRRRGGTSEFWLYFAISFPIFLTIAVLARLLPRSWRPGLVEVKGEGSVFGEAKAAANKVLPFVFMS
jgi:hypothetical protein